MEQKNNITQSPKEITIKDWEHFNKVCWKLEGCGSDSTDELIFRGQQDYTDSNLTPSLYREIVKRGVDQQKIYDIEEELITAFIKMWFPPQMEPYVRHNLLFQILSIMQHYGMKTRILDWTFSWLVAAYFAIENKDSNDKDAEVWCINKTQIENRLKGFCGEKEYNQRSFNRGISSLNDYNLCLKNGNKCPVKQLNNRIQCNAIFFKDILSSSTDVRMIIQASVFTYCPDPIADHIECIAKILGDDTGKYCTKMVIPAALKPQFMEKIKISLEYKEKHVFPTINQIENNKIFEGVISKYQNK